MRMVVSLACFAALSGGAFALSRRGNYGWTLFVMLPLIAGALGTWSFQPAAVHQAAKIGAIIGCIECGFFLVMGWEGIVCVLMALPILVPLTVLGAAIAYWSSPLSSRKQTVALGMLLPMTLFFDTHAKPPVYSVTTSIVVNAKPDRVWNYVVAFPDIQARPSWMLRTGVAYPIRTRIEGTGVGALRNCDLSTGVVEERVVVWEKPRLLRFVVTSTPPAMVETGLYGPVYPKHLNGYYVGKEGQFALSALPGGRTLVVGTSWYQHGLWPAEYWRWWSDEVVHEVHRRVLEHIRVLAEEGG